MNKNNLSKNLYEIRRRNGLSQEEMAEKLLVSRQAISKWERGEAYPDTENLIMISNMFGITLDDLVHSDLSAEPDDSEPIVTDKEDSDVVDDDASSKVSVNMTSSGLHIKVHDKEEDEDVSVNLSIPGLHINVNGKDDPDDDDDDDDDDDECDSGYSALRIWRALPYPIITTVAFLLIGFLAHGWSWAWTLFITIPVYYSLIDAIRHRRFSEFAYPVFTAFIYCLIGMLYGAWHPWWIIFVTIPIYYPIAEAIDKYFNKKKR